MLNAVRKQFGLHSEELGNFNKYEHLPTHDLHVGKNVMFQDATSKCQYPATITSLCSEPRSYNITTRDGITYRKTQTLLKPTHHKTRSLKLNILCHNQWHNLIICRQ